MADAIGKAEPTIKTQRDLRICELSSEGYSVRQVAARVTAEGWPIKRSQVNRVINAWLAELAEETKQHVRLLRARELEVTARIQREALSAWEKSKQKKVSTKVKQGKRAPKNGALPDDASALAGLQNTTVDVEKTEEHQVGNPRYLEVALAAGKRRDRLLGLEAPVKHALTDASGEKDLLEAFEGMDDKAFAALCRITADALSSSEETKA